MANVSDKESKVQQAMVKHINGLQGVFDGYTDKIGSMSDISTSRGGELDRINHIVDDTIRGIVGDISTYGQLDPSTFLYATASKLMGAEPGSEGGGFEDIISSFMAGNSEGMVSSLFNANRRSNLLYEDLYTVSKYIHELNEAINTTRDSIVTADDMSTSISKSITFDGYDQDSPLVKEYLTKIKTMERDYKLDKKLRDHIIPNELRFGKYYTYIMPYGKIITDMQNIQNKSTKMTTVMESYNPEEDDLSEEVSEELKGLLDNVIISNLHSDIIEDISISAEEIDLLKESATPLGYTTSNSTHTSVDGVKDALSQDEANQVKGCHLQLIDPRKMVPLKIIDKVVGYYYISDMGEPASRINTNGAKITSMSIQSLNKSSAEVNAKDQITGKLVDIVVKSFGKKFLEDNKDFKDLIMDSLMYHNIQKRKLSFQFIPAKYVVEFSVNHDENGEGQSILTDALFYAKLYLYLLIFNMICILTKSMDTKYHYVKTSGIDKNIANRIQKVSAKMKQSEMTYLDFANYGSTISKIGKASEVYVPVGSSGERGIETDILSGMNVQLHDELSEKLLTNMMNATGVPSVMMSYVNEADYARTLVMASAKYMTKVLNYQLDTNDANTELYQKLATFDGRFDGDLATLTPYLRYVLSPPKSLNIINISDLMNNGEQIINYIMKAQIGELSNTSEDADMLRDVYWKKVARSLFPMIDWNMYDGLLEESELEVVKIKALKKE